MNTPPSGIDGRNNTSLDFVNGVNQQMRNINQRPERNFFSLIVFCFSLFLGKVFIVFR